MKKVKFLNTATIIAEVNCIGKKPKSDEIRAKKPNKLFDTESLEKNPNLLNFLSKKPNWQACRLFDVATFVTSHSLRFRLLSVRMGSNDVGQAGGVVSLLAADLYSIAS